MYAISFYWLNESVHQKIDSVSARLFWQGLSPKKKYHMLKWAAMCRPKHYDGMGFSDCRTMNIFLLCKWIYRIEVGDQDPCCELLRKKYMQGKSFSQSL